MKLLSILKHGGIVLAAVVVLLGLPFFTSDYFAAMVSDTDAVSGASVIMDAPSGNYVIFINKDLHTDGEALDAWQSFFQGNDEIIFEDITVSVAQGDSGGMTMAESYQSRLPENQMVIKSDASVMMLSRLEADEYDIMVMSQEFADSYDAEKTCGKNTLILKVQGASNEET